MKKLFSISRNYPVNINLNDIVDKDVQSILLPLNLMQYISFCPKYRIKNNYITPNGFISNFVSLIGTLVFLFSYIYHTYLQTMDINYTGVITFVYVSYYFHCIFYCFGTIINFVNGVIYTRNAVKFVHTFQKIHRFLNCDPRSRNYIYWSWIIVIASICGFVAIIVPISVLRGIRFFYICVYCLVICYDFNIIYAIRVLKLLENKIIQWNFQVLNTNLHGKHFCKNMFKTYVGILECYDIHKVCFQQFILYYIIEIFSHCLVYVQVVIEMVINPKIVGDMTNAIVLGSLSVLCWLIKDLMWITMLCKQCEKFYLSVGSIQDCCATIQNSDCLDDAKRLCKNVRRLHRASFTKIRVCGLFYLDAALQLNLMSLLTNYTVVLLQFAIL